MKTMHLIIFSIVMAACGPRGKSKETTTAPAVKTLAPVQNQEPVGSQPTNPLPTLPPAKDDKKPASEQPKGETEEPSSQEPAPQPIPATPAVPADGGIMVGAAPQPVPIVPILLAGPAGQPIRINGPIQDQIQDCWKVTPYVCQIENIVAAQINQLRASYGVFPALPNYQLGFSARDWSTQMAATNVIVKPDLAGRLAVMTAEFGAAYVVSPVLTGSGVVSAPLIDPLTGLPLPQSAVGQIAAHIVTQLMMDIETSVLIYSGGQSFGVGIVFAANQVYATILFAN